MPRIEIDVDQILTSAVSLEIDPGDKVLVMSGVIIGVVGKQAIRQAPVETAPALAPAEREEPASRGRVTLPENLVLQKKTLELIRAKGPLTGRQLSSSLGGKHQTGMGRMAGVLKRLTAEGQIRRVNGDRYPAYVYAGNGPGT